MGRVRTSGIVLMASLALSALATAAVAPAGDDALVLAGPGGRVSTYLTPLVLYESGGALTFHNLDISVHDVVALEAGGPEGQPWCENFVVFTGECALFWSAQVELGQSTPVLGLENAVPGATYRFYCTLHRSMQGDLMVLEAS